MSNTYRLVTTGEAATLTLTTAESSDRRTAVKDLKQWADQNGHAASRFEGDLEATCQIQELELVQEDISTGDRWG